MPEQVTERLLDVPETPVVPKLSLARRIQQFAMVIGLVLLMAVVSRLSPDFLTTSNLLNVARQVSLTAILGAGMTVVIISGGIDLSVGSVVGLGTAVVANTVIATNGNIWLATVAGVAVGAAVGFGNGLVIAKLQIQPFIVTLASLTIVRGLVMIYTNAIPISIINYSSFSFLGGGYVGSIPTPIIIAVVTFAVSWFLLTKTLFGRYVFAIGNSEATTRLAGVNVDFYKILIYIFNGALAGLTSAIFASRLMTGDPTLGAGFELTAITMVILGGTSFIGGQGSLWGTVVGACILGVISNALNLLNVSSFYQDLSTGVVILIAVILDRLLRQQGS